MNIDKLDTKAMTMIVLACTAVVLGVLVIDMQIAKSLALRAQEFDNALRRMHDGVEENRGSHSRAGVAGNHAGISVVRDSGVEAGTDSASDRIPMEGWDVFPINRTAVAADTGAGIRRMAIPEKRGPVAK